MRARRGLALLLVVGVLAMMAVLGSAFAVLSRLERRAALQRVHATRAFLLARSGLEDALARVGSGQDPSVPESAYKGEDWDDSGAVTGLERAAEAFRPNKPNLLDCPVRYAMRPSFFQRSGDVDANGRKAPVRMSVGGRSRGYSGKIGNSTALTWALKVEDESGKLDVNGGLHGGWDQLGRVLNGLRAGVPGLPATFASDILSKRPPTGYRSIEDLQAAIGCTTDLSPYLTTSSWSDTKVVRPNAKTSAPNNLGEFGQKTFRTPLALEAGGRPPVNLNVAPFPVLVALLRDVSGGNFQPNARISTVGMGAGFSANLIATAIVNFRTGKDPGGFFAAAGLTPRPFTTWSGFRAFLYTLVRTGGGITGVGAPASNGGNLDGVDLILANFCPETGLNKQHPDEILFRWIDKSDLLVWSTEGCFFPTGIFRISSVGRALDSQGSLLAERTLAMTAEDFTLLRQTSQKDFVGGRTRFQEYLSRAKPGHLTHGADAPLVPSWKTWTGSEGLGVMTYPCPPTAVAAGNAFELDGQIGLATVEMAPLDPPGPGLPAPYPKLLFLHHFDDSWDADYSPGGGRARVTPGPPNDGVSPASDAELQPNVAESVWPRGANVAGAGHVEPNTLYPDGFHTLRGHAPAFDAVLNLPAATSDPVANRGVMGYWVKANRFRQPLLGSINMAHFSCCREGAINASSGKHDTQTLITGRVDARWGVELESKAVNDDLRYEVTSDARATFSNYNPPDHRWRFVTAFWDSSQVRGMGLDVDYLLQGVSMTVRPSPGPSPYGEDLVVAENENLLEPGLLFALGPQEDSEFQYAVRTADDVLDEFAIYDFGPVAALARPASDAWALSRYRDGRYYRGEDGRFTSAPVAPVPGGRVTLLRAYWTAWMPQDPYREPWLTNNGMTVNDAGRMRTRDPNLANASVGVSLLKPNPADPPNPEVLPLTQGGSLHERLGSFQYRVEIKTGIPAGALDTPALETPFFDDITFVYRRSGGPKILFWDRS